VTGEHASMRPAAGVSALTNRVSGDIVMSGQSRKTPSTGWLPLLTGAYLSKYLRLQGATDNYRQSAKTTDADRRV
jgi:hypothetical protein